MKLTTTAQVSVDGVMQGPGEDERGVFERGEWAHFDNSGVTIQVYRPGGRPQYGTSTAD
jgi:hypothetical protein